MSFPALGFDPAPGDPEAVAGTARRLRRVADELGHQAAALQRAAALTSSWQGSAACAYAGQVAARVADLRTAAEVLGAVSGRLLWWSGELRDLQELALRLERAAGPASTAVCLPGPAAELEALRARARRLRERAEHSARFVAAEVRAAVAASPAGRSAGWTDAPFGIPIGRWVVEREDALGVMADVSGGTAIALGVAGLVAAPFVAVPAGVAALGYGLAATGLAAHTAMAHYGDGSWTDVGLDLAGFGAAGLAVHGVRRGLPTVERIGDGVGHGLNAWSAQDIARRRLGGTRTQPPPPRPAPSLPALRQPQTPETRRIDASRRAVSRRALDALLVAPVS